MTTVLSKPKDYRLLVGARYLDASDRLLKGMRAVHQENPFHFLVSLRSFIEYTRRGVWFLVWASNAQLMEAEHLTFKQAGSPHLTKMDAMLNKAMGAGKVSHLTVIVDGVNEPFIECLHALTHTLPTLENACETADEIAVALLQVPGKAKPSDLVLYVLHNGLSVATAHKPPAWQHHFRYVAAETMEANVPWWKVMGISNLDDLENPRKRKQ
jgi:hypothetical protein